MRLVLLCGCTVLPYVCAESWLVVKSVPPPVFVLQLRDVSSGCHYLGQVGCFSSSN